MWIVAWLKWSPAEALVPRMPASVVWISSSIYQGIVVSCKGVSNQEAQGRLNNDDGRIRTKKDLDIGTICFEGVG
jgi:hypothetical protein